MPPSDSQFLMNITARPDVVMTHGQGSFLYDDRGRRYLDFIQGWAVNTLGHAPREVHEELAEQSLRLLTPSPAFHNEPQLAAARRLAELSGLDQVFFTNSGAEANEGAIKLCRKWGRVRRGGAFTIVTTDGGFHGRTLATMAASGKPGWDDLFPPRMEGFRKVPFGDLEAMARAVGEDTVAILVEPIQGEAGVVVPPNGYLRGLRALADRAGVLLVLDEVQTGIGRTGELFAFQSEGALPDVLTLGKGLGGGVPIAALLARAHACCFEQGDQGGTYNGNPLMTAVANRVLDVVAEPRFLESVRRAGDHLAGAVGRALELAGLVEVRGRGLLRAAVLQAPIAFEIRDRALGRGLLVNAPRPNVLRFMPSLRVTLEEIGEMGRVLAASVP